MKRLLLALTAALLLAAAPWDSANVAEASCYTSGYYRADGTYVSAYYRSCPNSTVTDNYTYINNYNPYTGASGTNYYRSSPSSPYYSPSYSSPYTRWP